MSYQIVWYSSNPNLNSVFCQVFKSPYIYFSITIMFTLFFENSKKLCLCQDFPMIKNKLKVVDWIAMKKVYLMRILQMHIKILLYL